MKDHHLGRISNALCKVSRLRVGYSGKPSRSQAQICKHSSSRSKPTGSLCSASLVRDPRIMLRDWEVTTTGTNNLHHSSHRLIVTHERSVEGVGELSMTAFPYKYACTCLHCHERDRRMGGFISMPCRTATCKFAGYCHSVDSPEHRPLPFHSHPLLMASLTHRRNWYSNPRERPR